MLNITNIFVYGTLKPGESNYQCYCAGKVLESKRAIARGNLFSLPFGYPAMTLGESLVHGFLLSFPNSDILHQLDWLEDYNSRRPAAENEYNRQLIDTYNSAFRSLGTAWVYLMTPSRVCACNGVFISDGWWSAYGLSSPRYTGSDKAN